MVVRQTVDAHALLSACHRLPFDNLMNEDCVLFLLNQLSSVFRLTSTALYTSSICINQSCLSHITGCLHLDGCKNLRLYGQASRAISTG